MRWDALFADMELQLDAAASLDREIEVADRTRNERARVLLADRLHAAVGAPVGVTAAGGRLSGVVADAGPTWVLIRDGGREHLVPLTAIVWVEGADRAQPVTGEVGRRLSLGHALRAIARDRSVVDVVTAAGVVRGRIQGVGADHVDVAPAFGDSRRPTGGIRAVPFVAVQVVSST